MGLQTGEFTWSELLTFLQELAELFGRGLSYLLNLVLPRGVNPDLVVPLGYLALFTLVLLVFDLIAAARKAIWLVLGVGWVLVLVRILLDAFGG